MPDGCSIAGALSNNYGTSKLLKHCVDNIGGSLDCKHATVDCKRDWGSAYIATGILSHCFMREGKKERCWADTTGDNMAACCTGRKTGKENCRPNWKPGSYLCNMTFGKKDFTARTLGKDSANSLASIQDPRPQLYVTLKAIFPSMAIVVFFIFIAHGMFNI